MELHSMSCQEEYEKIIASDLPDLRKLARAFDCITGFIVSSAGGDIEVARALHDRDTLVKTQIKMETIKHARSIFEDCYQRVTGEWPWPDGRSKRDEA